MDEDFGVERIRWVGLLNFNMGGLNGGSRNQKGWRSWIIVRILWMPWSIVIEKAKLVEVLQPHYLQSLV